MPAADRLAWSPDRPIAWESDGQAFWLFGSELPMRIAGSSACILGRLLAVRRTVADIVAAAARAGLAPLTAHALLNSWQARGLVVSAPSDHSDREGDPQEEPGPQDTARLAAELGRLLPAGHQDTPLCVVEDLFDPGLPALAGPALVISLNGPEVILAVVDCPACLAARYRFGQSYSVGAAKRCGLDRPPVVSRDPDVAADLAAGLLGAVVEGDSNVLLSTNESVELPVRHVLVPVPGCPRCDPGGSSLGHPEPESASRRHQNSADSDDENHAAILSNEGGYRVQEPDATWGTYRHLIGNLVGAVPYVEPAGDPRLNVFVAGPNPATQSTTDLDRIISGARARSAGKGLTPAAARTGALCEALERFSLLYRGDEPSRHATFDALDHDALHPNAISLFSDTQLDEAEQVWESGGSFDHRFVRVPRRFDPGVEVEWTAAECLNGEGTCWVPSSLVWFRHPDSGRGGYAACSNGAAAGNTVAEATVQGLLELIERDSVALWWYPRARRPALDLIAASDPRIGQALAQIAREGRQTWVLDLTSDIGVPACVAVNVTDGGTEPVLGFGAHIDPVIACVRALNEVAQFTLATDAPECAQPGNSLEQDWFLQASTKTEPWLAPSGLVPMPPSPAPSSVSQTLDDLVNRMTERRLQVLRVDATRRDIGLPVVRVLVPGLRHFWNRFAPGRLYEVPVELGWRSDPFGEDDLNPWRMFL
jgi:ribosomal protein S12 methylthiotransferase accessory factor